MPFTSCDPDLCVNSNGLHNVRVKKKLNVKFNRLLPNPLLYVVWRVQVQFKCMRVTMKSWIAVLLVVMSCQ